jgi:hypothetical protein
MVADDDASTWLPLAAPFLIEWQGTGLASLVFFFITVTRAAASGGLTQHGWPSFVRSQPEHYFF